MNAVEKAAETEGREGDQVKAEVKVKVRSTSTLASTST